MRTFRHKSKEQDSKKKGKKELDTEARIGIYARQSTVAQLKNNQQSTQMQTEDLTDYAKELGWDEGNIIEFTQDFAKSGALPIAKREGLRTLIKEIEADRIKTVLVFLEDRLFRDTSAIQYNLFLQICQEHDVKVVTRSKTYDFSNDEDVEQFRSRCKAAAEFLKDMKLRLQGAKNRLSANGMYAGRAVAIGFLVDKEEKIIVEEKIVPNPTYRKFIVYEPHAKIVRWLFRRFWELGGRVRPLCRELHQLPFVFPDFEPEVDISQYISQYHLKKVPGGYHISRPGLMGLLTNVAYIGYWIHQGEVVSKDNHKAIVDLELFWYAFNHLSPYTTTGERNEQKHGYTRYSRKDPIPALLKKVIDSREGGRVYVSTSGLSEKPIYVIEEKDQRLVLKYHAATPCKEIDDLFATRLVEHMKQTKRYEHYQNYMTELQEEREDREKFIKKELAEIDEQMEGKLASLSLPPKKLSASARERLADEYSQLEGLKENLEAERVTLYTDQKAQQLMDYYLLADKLAIEWENIPFPDRQDLAEVLTKGVYLDEMTTHWLRLEVEWLDPEWGIERTYIFRPGGGHKTWTDVENEIIAELAPRADRGEILQKMPRRSWSAIMQQARKLGVQRPRNLISDCSIPENTSVEDIAFMQEAGIAVNERYCHKWETVRQLQSSTSMPCHLRQPHLR